MNRRVEPEILDELPAEDPRAMRSRSDLQKVNTWMRNARIMATELSSASRGQRPRKLVEIGAGDGTFLLRVARKLGSEWEGTTAVLVDRKNILAAGTRQSFDEIGWQVEAVSSDVFDWLEAHGSEPRDVIMANLFLHHFTESQLAMLFRKAADKAQAFIAVEPRRWTWSLIFGRLLWLIGCNSVTRHDAIISIRAGFASQELTKLWPANGDWHLQERAENFSSHLFVAQRGSGCSSSSSSFSSS